MPRGGTRTFPGKSPSLQDHRYGRCRCRAERGVAECPVSADRSYWEAADLWWFSVSGKDWAGAGAGLPANVSSFAVGRWLWLATSTLELAQAYRGRHPGRRQAAVRGTGPLMAWTASTGAIVAVSSWLTPGIGTEEPPGGRPSVPSCSRLPIVHCAWRSRCPHWNGDGLLPASFIYGGVLDRAVLVALAPVMLLACPGLPATFRPRPVTNARAYRIATTISRNW